VLPDTLNGLPLHPLAVHAPVVLIPLAALLGVTFAVPALRAWSRWPLALVSLGAAVAAFVFWSHRANIGRLRRGEESRVRRGRAAAPDPRIAAEPGP